MCCAAFIALFFPPLGVLMMEGCGVDFCLNIFLTLLFYIPGLIHAFIVICRDEPRAVPVTVVVT